MVRVLKVIGLGTLIWFGTFVAIILATVTFGIAQAMRSGVAGGSIDVRATSLSVIVVSPIPYLIILAAYGVAYWLVRK